jgi:hypothetical protein
MPIGAALSWDDAVSTWRSSVRDADAVTTDLAEIGTALRATPSAALPN